MAMNAFVGVRSGPNYRFDAICDGLRRAGYNVIPEITARPRDGDILVIWNRYTAYDKSASAFEAIGAPVFVVENGYWGNEFAGKRWYSISLNYHNGAGTFRVGGNDRWDSLGVELEPWRDGKEVIVLPQRGIGCDGVRMPDTWLSSIVHLLNKCGIGHRIRHHPGQNPNIIPLEEDIKKCEVCCYVGFWCLS